jgi:poly(3-hydroxybutyrate) depolymerase
VPLQGDLAEAPFRLTLPPSTHADGSYDLMLRLRIDGRLLGDTALGIFVVNGLDQDISELTQRTNRLSMRGALRSTIGCPASMAFTLNDRTRQPTEIVWRDWLDATKTMLAQVEQGRDPLLSAKGDITRCYAGEISARAEPFRLYIPQSWDGRAKLPLVILLHGSNGDQNRMLANGKAASLAEKYGWAVLSPMGYSPNSGWGNHLPVVLANGTMPAPRPSTIAGVVLPKDGVDPEPAEEDVYAAMREVQRDYPIDAQRIYLAGNSMGGEGVWHLAQRQPSLWAAVAPGAGAIDPKHYPYARLGKLPVLGVHGDKDEIISFPATQDMIARLNQAGGNGTMLAVPGGSHRAFDSVLDQIFVFFASHARQPGAPDKSNTTK